MIGWLFKMPFYLLGSIVRGMTYSPRRRSRYYWHGYCKIHHQRQDTADRCAASAAYKKVEREARARENAELARREAQAAERAANPVEYDGWGFLAGLAMPVVVVVVVLLLCLLA